MTVYEYLKFVAELKKARQEKEKRNDSRCHGHDRHHGGEKPSHKEPFQGLQTKSGFAQALLGYPEIIILDEPTVGLDPKQIIEIRELIKKAWRKSYGDT